MSAVSGRCFITVKGDRLASKEGSTLKYGGLEREMVVADTGPVGPQSKVVAPGFECVLVHTAKTSLAAIQGIENENASFDTDSGKSFVLTGVCLLNSLELSKGEVKCTFGALTCEEV